MGQVYNHQFDHYARNFLAYTSEAVVVHIGCAVEARLERVDTGRVEWYDLDLPEVIGLPTSAVAEGRVITAWPVPSSIRGGSTT